MFSRRIFAKKTAESKNSLRFSLRPGNLPRDPTVEAGTSIASLLDAIVDVLDADDVVLAEVRAGLDLDQLQVDLARIGEPVDHPDRQEDRLVLVDDLLLLAARHLGGASDDDPMLGAMEMPLQRKLLSGRHDDALDLIART